MAMTQDSGLRTQHHSEATEVLNWGTETATAGYLRLFTLIFQCLFCLVEVLSCHYVSNWKVLSSLPEWKNVGTSRQTT
jgi:hypothetical protein